ncbi:MAG: N-6 DNA methylase [Planctomycetaceae bacterium]
MKEHGPISWGSLTSTSSRSSPTRLTRKRGILHPAKRRQPDGADTRPKEGESIYDPACGTGGMLIEAIHHVNESGGNVRTLWGKLFGQEKNLTTSAIARMNLFLHGVEDFQVVRGDTLRQPAFHTGDNLAKFDCVIANPPFSLEKWGEDVWASDPYGRNFAGMPPAKSGDFAWVQHMLKSMAPKSGRMAVVLPHGALFRMGAEGKIRKKLLNHDSLDAVIGLGPNLFYGTGLAACILVFRDKKPVKHRKKVLIIDASSEFKKGRAQNELLPEHVDRIFELYKAHQDIDGLARLVTLDEIRRTTGISTFRVTWNRCWKRRRLPLRRRSRI